MQRICNHLLLAAWLACVGAIMPSVALATAVDETDNSSAAKPTTEPAAKDDKLAATKTVPDASAANKSDSREAPEAVNLSELEERLVDTDAIGFFTKLELKSQLDDLTDRFREFHDQTQVAELAELKEKFDLLLLKLLTLLQDDDPDLHRDIAAARPAIWRTLADPELFAKL